MEITFKSDTKHRKQWFTGVSFSHPAKMSLPLQLWLIENYTQPGETILDPMAGSGTILVACSIGRNVIAVELESKFIEIMKGNWAKIQERGPMMGCEMGKAQILQGDARNLEGLLVDKCIFSPPYAEAQSGGGLAVGLYTGKKGHSPNKMLGKYAYTPETHGKEEGQIGNLPYGKINHVIMSPPYASGGHHADQTGAWGGQGQALTKEQANYGQAQGQIGHLPYGKINHVIMSPPYAETIANRQNDKALQKFIGDLDGGSVIAQSKDGYTDNPSNIGNLKSTSYLKVMLAVYRSCFAGLKPGGLLILILKNFIRDRKEVRLDEDTIKLCESAGFVFKERHYRRLTQQSFWRTIYKQKYPDAPVLDKEDILVFSKPLGG